MVLFKKKVKPGEHQIVKEGPEEIIHINYENYPRNKTISFSNHHQIQRAVYSGAKS